MSARPVHRPLAPSWRWASILFALAIVLTAATQLRFGSLPAGPGEALLAGLCGLILLRMTAWPQLYRPMIPFVWFTLASGVLLILAFLVQILGDPAAQNTDTASGLWLRDSLAYGLSAAMIIALCADSPMIRQPRMLLQATVLIGAGLPLVLVAIAQVTPTVAGLDLIYGGGRFMGLSSDPNQLARALAPIPFFALYLAWEDRGSGRLVWIACALSVIPAGLATGSEGLILAWLCAAYAIGLAWFVFAASKMLRSINFVTVSVATVHLLAGSLVWLIAPGFWPGVLDAVLRSTSNLDHRLALWDAGIDKILASPVIGYGPGARVSIVQPVLSRDYEAHNFLLDWALATGLLGLVCLLILLGWILKTVLQARSLWLVGALAAVLVFSLGIHPFRNPNFWFFLILTVLTAAQRILPMERRP